MVPPARCRPRPRPRPQLLPTHPLLQLRNRHVCGPRLRAAELRPAVEGARPVAGAVGGAGQELHAWPHARQGTQHDVMVCKHKVFAQAWCTVQRYVTGAGLGASGAAAAWLQPPRRVLGHASWDPGARMGAQEDPRMQWQPAPQAAASHLLVCHGLEARIVGALGAAVVGDPWKREARQGPLWKAKGPQGREGGGGAPSRRCGQRPCGTLATAPRHGRQTKV